MSICNCLNIDLIVDGEPVQIQAFDNGNVVNGAPQFEAELPETQLYVEYDIVNGRWIMYVGNDPFFAFFTSTNEACPFGIWAVIFDPNNPNNPTFVEVSECIVPICVVEQERTIKTYPAIRLPEVFMEQDRGFKVCCDCPMLVLGSPESETWKTDITSAWIKLSGPADLGTFTLLKNGMATNYIPPVFSFVKEPNAFYTTINWFDVLQTDGVGCYELKVGYNIAGVVGEFTWGIYDLKPYSITNALQTARIRVKYNLKQQIEGIDFTDSNVEDCIRFNGFIGERQPNTEIDNLIYQDRIMKTVQRENLDTYIITTDPLLECFIRVLTDLYLLSENEMYISDYNAHNHSYRILDVPVVLEETSEIDYLDPYQRRAKLTAVVGIRKKNKRTFY
jgi:hypothetical protein